MFDLFKALFSTEKHDQTLSEVDFGLIMSFHMNLGSAHQTVRLCANFMF